jgi:hypothetical protein
MNGVLQYIFHEVKEGRLSKIKAADRAAVVSESW